MHTKLMRSQTAEFPTPRDLIAAALQRLRTEGASDAWVHIERVKQAGWFKTLMSQGNRPYVEVIFISEGAFGLNATGVEAGDVAAQTGWVWREQEHVWEAPLADEIRLVEWIADHLGLTAEEGGCLEAYIDGL